jgi:hypothetical protein
MKPSLARTARSAALTLPLTMALSGCLFTTRKLPVPKAPTVTQTATAQELAAGLNQRWEKMDTLRADVQIQFTQIHTQAGVAKDYTSFPGIVLLRKPKMLRVLGQVPVVHTRMFDMVSTGQDFTLYVPSKSLAYKGPNQLTHKSPNSVENIRPGFFLDSLVVRGLETDDEYMVTADTDTVEDPKRKKLYVVPEYIFSVMRRKAGTQELRPMRVIHFHREDLLPYQQDLYDEQGTLETQVTYGRYADYGDNKFPSTVTIKRPQDGFQAVLTVERVTENVPLKDDQFQIQLPPDTNVQNLQ